MGPIYTILKIVWTNRKDMTGSQSEVRSELWSPIFGNSLKGSLLLEEYFLVGDLLVRHLHKRNFVNLFDTSWKFVFDLIDE